MENLYFEEGERKKRRNSAERQNSFFLARQEGLEPPVSYTHLEYTGNGLVDAILGVAFSLAEQGGVYVEYDCGRLPEPLFVADDDLTSVLMNVLENAVEGCGRLADPGERWLFFRLCLAGGSLTLECRNSAPPGTEDRTSKRDRRAHGFGLSILRGIAPVSYTHLDVYKRQPSTLESSSAA